MKRSDTFLTRLPDLNGHLHAFDRGDGLLLAQKSLFVCVFEEFILNGPAKSGFSGAMGSNENRRNFCAKRSGENEDSMGSVRQS